jgi:hypothetical protein
VFRTKYLPVFFAIFFLAGCATDKIGLELVEYVNHGILNISQLEIKALESYGAVTGANYTTDQAVSNALKNEVIPLYGRFAALLKQVGMQSDEVRQLHALYVNGAEMIYSGFKAKLQALENKDAALMQGANAQIENGRMQTEKWRAQLMALYEAHGVRSAKETGDSALKRQLIEPIPD